MLTRSPVTPFGCPVCHAYALDRKQTAFVLDDFHRVQNPRLMDDDYFEMVLEKYDHLA